MLFHLHVLNAMYAQQTGSLFNDWRGGDQERPNVKYHQDYDGRGYIHPHPLNRVAGAVMNRVWLVTTEEIRAGSELLAPYGKMFCPEAGGWAHHEVCVCVCVVVCVRTRAFLVRPGLNVL